MGEVQEDEEEEGRRMTTFEQREDGYSRGERGRISGWVGGKREREGLFWKEEDEEHDDKEAATEWEGRD